MPPSLHKFLPIFSLLMADFSKSPIHNMSLFLASANLPELLMLGTGDL